jgi:hypothetical protein
VQVVCISRSTRTDERGRRRAESRIHFYWTTARTEGWLCTEAGYFDNAGQGVQSIAHGLNSSLSSVGGSRRAMNPASSPGTG